MTETKISGSVGSELLKQSDENIDIAIAKYERDKAQNEEASRERVEKAYCQKMDLLYSMVKQAHPLSEEGMQELHDAAACRKEAESLIGPMITTITDTNISMFSTVLTEELKEDIICGKCRAIGAFRTTFELVYGVGALVFHIDTDPDNSNDILKIDWLYVDSMFRRQGVCDFLIAELINRMTEVGIERLTVSFPSKNDHKLQLEYIFAAWQFKLASGVSPENVICVDDITDYDLIEEAGGDVQPISELDEKMKDKMIKTALRKFGAHGYPSAAQKHKAYFDLNLSGYMGTAVNPEAVILVHKTPGGIYRVDYRGCKKGEEINAVKLSAFVLLKAMTYKGDPIVMIPYKKEVSEFLEKICPRQLGQYLVTGELDRSIYETGGR